MKIKKRARADFEFLVRSDLNMIGAEIGTVHTSDPDGHSALECWVAFDSRGVVLPCREPKILAKVRQSKASWNLQVKLWAEDLADGMLLTLAELRDYCAELPAWIFDATVAQARRLILSRIGFVPSFLQV